MANQTGIAIVIKAFLPIGKSFDEQFAAMKKVNDAHESGEYGDVLTACGPDNIEIKAERKTRRVDDTPAETEPEPETTEADSGDAPTDPAKMQTRKK